MFDWIVTLIGKVGYAGVAFLMFLENLFPPIPSELVMPLAGFEAARSDRTLLGMVIAGSLGSLAGATFWYWVGRKYKARRLRHLAERHGRWLTLTPEEVDRAIAWFDRYGPAAVFIGRLLPGLRTLISVPAGIARMPLPAFLAWSAAGTTLWVILLAGAGYLLESQYDRVAALLNPVSTAILIGMIAVYIWRVATYDRRLDRQSPAPSDQG